MSICLGSVVRKFALGSGFAGLAAGLAWRPYCSCCDFLLLVESVCRVGFYWEEGMVVLCLCFWVQLLELLFQDIDRTIMTGCLEEIVTHKFHVVKRCWPI